MWAALQEGRNALPECLPNPTVGCVLVRDEQIIACGYTQSPGQPHAEAMTLSQVSGDLSGVSEFVTLEPCSLHGRTPSCAKALIDRGIGRVFVATLDPNRRNAGAGIKAARSGGHHGRSWDAGERGASGPGAVFGERVGIIAHTWHEQGSTGLRL